MCLVAPSSAQFTDSDFLSHLNTAKLDAVEQAWAAVHTSKDCFKVKDCPEKISMTFFQDEHLWEATNLKSLWFKSQVDVLSQPAIFGRKRSQTSVHNCDRIANKSLITCFITLMKMVHLVRWSLFMSSRPNEKVYLVVIADKLYAGYTRILALDLLEQVRACQFCLATGKDAL